MSSYKAIGMMSGTSLDGVDIVLADFIKEKDAWRFTIEKAHTYSYTQEWKNILQGIKYNTPAFEFLKIDQEYGIYLGNLLKEFLKECNSIPMFIASHGHTIFHQPYKGITCQIGNGNNIAALTGLPVINDFRSKDVAYSGQGAPLVPVGDMLLFPEYKYCLNFGGFANISIKRENRIKAFDICPVNIILNFLVSDIGLDFDKDGIIGSKGQVNNDLLNSLNKLAYYKITGPKSLGKEWFEEHFIPVLYYFNIPIEDKLRTIYSHIICQIKNVLEDDKEKILLSGGGALNSYLILLLKSQIKQEIVLPSYDIINFKEALIFAFLGVLRMNGEINIYSDVTGASSDSCGGAVYF